jgi:hypothetical protein
LAFFREKCTIKIPLFFFSFRLFLFSREKKFSSAASQKKKRGQKISIASEKREKRTHNETLDKEREGKEKNDDDIRCNNQYSHEYY